MQFIMQFKDFILYFVIKKPFLGKIIKYNSTFSQFLVSYIISNTEQLEHKQTCLYPIQYGSTSPYQPMGPLFFTCSL